MYVIRQIEWTYTYICKPYKGVINVANRDIKKEVKKKKKGSDTGALPSLKPIMTEPELVKKPKKN